MKEVAAYKVKHKMPDEQLSREGKVTQMSKENAQEHGPDSLYIESFARALIKSDKTIQYRYLAACCRKDIYIFNYPEIAY